MMQSIFNDILEMLDDDMISHGFFWQCVEESENHPQSPAVEARELLTELLASGMVEIGVTEQLKPDYLEFVAWKGTVDERVHRAMESVDKAVGHDKEFAYWLCLRKNIDRFEGEE